MSADKLAAMARHPAGARGEGERREPRTTPDSPLCRLCVCTEFAHEVPS